jgi:hypothetical protein
MIAFGQKKAGEVAGFLVGAKISVVLAWSCGLLCGPFCGRRDPLYGRLDSGRGSVLPCAPPRSVPPCCVRVTRPFSFSLLPFVTPR